MRLRFTVALALLAAAPGCAQQPSEDAFTAGERWKHYVQCTYSPERLGLLAVDTAIDQAMNNPSRWNSGAGSYEWRYARTLERRIVRNTAELGTGLLTGEDLRYRRSQSHSITARAWDAVRASFTARMPDGTRRPAYTRFFAAMVTDAAIPYCAHRSFQPGWMILQAPGWSVVNQAQTNLLDEFGPDLRRFGLRIGRCVRLHRLSIPSRGLAVPRP